MRLRNFLSWFASSIIAFIIILLLINIVTSIFVDVSIDHTMPLIIGSIYDYASVDAQNKTQVTFSSLCQGVSETLNRSQSPQSRPECLPANQESVKLVCAKLNTLPIEQQEQFKDSCKTLADGTLKKSCEQSADPKFDIQVQALSQGCKQLSGQEINTRDFLVGPLASLLVKSIDNSLSVTENSTALANISQSQNINLDVLKYAIHYIQGKDKDNYLVAKIVSILLLFILWFVVSQDLSDYLHSVSRMFFSTGMLIFATWVISFILVVFFAPNTTSLLLIVSGQSGTIQPPINDLFALLPVIVLELTSDAILIIAAASIIIAFLLYLLRRYYIDPHYSSTTSSENTPTPVPPQQTVKSAPRPPK